MANVLIVDDDRGFSHMLSAMVERLGHNAAQAFSLGEGLEQSRSTAYDVVFLDVRLPDGNGLETLSRFRDSTSSPEIIIITGFGDSDGAELAIRNGAWDYIQKASPLKEITLPFVRALEYRAVKALKQPFKALKIEGIVGRSPQMRASLNLVAQAANSDANVLITGETGTGKELFARAIHVNSARADRSFVVVDCAALPQNLVESTLFGHEKGAFTGADKARVGLIRQAHGGTLFLDEVGELPLPLQKSFLRVLQERRFRPLGSGVEASSDFRLISATNKDIVAMLEHGQFREDLLFRLRTLTIELPPLRDHREDVAELLVFYVKSLCERYGIGLKGFAKEFIDALTAYSWPGNVREFVGAMERAVSAAFHEPTLYLKHLPPDIRISLIKSALTKEREDGGVRRAEQNRTTGLLPLKEFREVALRDVEKQYLEDLLVATARNVKEACRISGLSRSRLYNLLKKYSV